MQPLVIFKRVALLGAWKLLGAPGLTTRSKDDRVQVVAPSSALSMGPPTRPPFLHRLVRALSGLFGPADFPFSTALWPCMFSCGYECKSDTLSPKMLLCCSQTAGGCRNTIADVSTNIWNLRNGHNKIHVETIWGLCWYTLVLGGAL